MRDDRLVAASDIIGELGGVAAGNRLLCLDLGRNGITPSQRVAQTGEDPTVRRGPREGYHTS